MREGLISAGVLGYKDSEGRMGLDRFFYTSA